MCQDFVTRKWGELFIFQHLSSSTRERTSGSNLKLYIQTLSSSGCIELILNNWLYA